MTSGTNARDREFLARLRDAVDLACTAQNTSRIVQGREQVLALPREAVLRHLETVAAQTLDLSDEWEYRRLLELAELLDPALTQRTVALGLERDDPAIREAAEDFRR